MTPRVAQSNTPQMQLTAQNLTGRYVRLEPLAEAHREGLRVAASDPDLWAFMPLDGSGAGFDGWFDTALQTHASGSHIAFAVRRLSDGALVGSTRFLEIVPAHRRAEIGRTWYARDAQAGAVNPECKYLLLDHAFTAGANRVELKTGAQRPLARRHRQTGREAGRHFSLAYDRAERPCPRHGVFLDHPQRMAAGVRSRLVARLAAG